MTDTISISSKHKDKSFVTTSHDYYEDDLRTAAEVENHEQ